MAPTPSHDAAGTGTGGNDGDNTNDDCASTCPHEPTTCDEYHSFATGCAIRCDEAEKQAMESRLCDASAPTEKTRTLYIVKHRIALKNMAASVFNSNANIKKSFRSTVSLLLNVAIENVMHVRACLVGQTEAECPGDVTADTSAAPKTSTTGGSNGGRRRRLLSGENDSEVKYEIVMKSEVEMNKIVSSIKGTTYQEEGRFAKEFTGAMKSNLVDASIAEGVTVKTDSPPSTEVEEVPGENAGGPQQTNDASSSPEGSSGDDESKEDPWFFVGIAAGLIGLAAFAGTAYFLLNKKQRRRNSSRQMVGDQEVELGSYNPSYAKTRAVEATIVGVPTTQAAPPLNGGNSQWNTHQTPEGTAYYHDESTGRTTWTEPANLVADPALLKIQKDLPHQLQANIRAKNKKNKK